MEICMLIAGISHASQIEVDHNTKSMFLAYITGLFRLCCLGLIDSSLQLLTK